MTRSDLEEVVDAWEALLANGHDADPRFRARPGARSVLREHLLARVFGAFHPFPPAWVARADGRVVGWIQGGPVPTVPLLDQPPVARIMDLWVAPFHRRMGLGRRLVTTFVDHAHRAGYPTIEVGTLTADERARAFWRGVGFDDWQVLLRHEA